MSKPVSGSEGIHVEWLDSTTAILFIAVFASSGVGGLLICLRSNWSTQSLLMMVSAGGGLLLAITLLDLLPHSVEEDGGRLIPLILLGFSILFVFELLRGNEEREGAAGLIGVFVGLSVHALMEGMSLMASYRVDVTLGHSLLVALIIHKIPDGITMASLFLATTRSRSLALLASASLGLFTFIGVILMTIADSWLSPQWSHIVLALTTGIFLYVSASNLVPIVRKNGGLQAGLCFFAAIVAYMLVMFFADQTVHPHV